ncbi:MAG: hypothetical protein ACI4ON_01360 [Clostridia bacterium]
MFDCIWGNSYIDVRYEGRLFLEENYDSLKSKMNDSSSTITVHVLDFLGIGSTAKTFKKSDISYWGSN